MSMSGCPLREWGSDQIRVETTQVEADFLAKTIIGDFYLKLSTTQYTLQITLLIISGGTIPHSGQPMLAGVPILCAPSMVLISEVKVLCGGCSANH